MTCTFNGLYTWVCVPVFLCFCLLLCSFPPLFLPSLCFLSIFLVFSLSPHWQVRADAQPHLVLLTPSPRSGALTQHLASSAGVWALGRGLEGGCGDLSSQAHFPRLVGLVGPRRASAGHQALPKGRGGKQRAAARPHHLALTQGSQEGVEPLRPDARAQEK